MNTHTYIDIHNIYIYIYIFTYIHTYLSMHHVCMYIPKYQLNHQLYVHMHVYTLSYAHIHTHTHMHIISYVNSMSNRQRSWQAQRKNTIGCFFFLFFGKDKQRMCMKIWVICCLCLAFGMRLQPIGNFSRGSDWIAYFFFLNHTKFAIIVIDLSTSIPNIR